MAEKRQSWPAVGTNFRLDDVKAAIGKFGRLVMVRYGVETEGKYAGRAVRCWVGKYQVGTVEAESEGPFRQFIEAMAAEGLPATCRARFDRSETWPRLWMVGELERRASDAPFLPPLTEIDVEVEEPVAQMLNSRFESKAKTKTATRVGTLLNVQGRTWLALDDAPTGRLPGPERDDVDQAMSAGLPVTCSVTIKRRAERPLAVTVDVPDERGFGPSIGVTVTA